MIDEQKLIEELKPEVYKAYIAYKMGHEYWDKGYMDGLEFAIHKIESLMKDGGWIPVEERLPEEHDSVFAKLKGTDKWLSGMFEKRSDEVIVACEYGDGTRVTKTSRTIDGKWSIETKSISKLKVLFWRPLPELYECHSKKLERRNRMTNLEYYKDEINGFIKEKSFGSVSCAIKYGFEEFAIKYIENYKNRPCEFVDWLLSEHKEPIKLKQWEKDLLELCSPFAQFGEVYVTSVMKTKGHFKGIIDTNMGIKEILENCEVEDR